MMKSGREGCAIFEQSQARPFTLSMEWAQAKESKLATQQLSSDSDWTENGETGGNPNALQTNYTALRGYVKNLAPRTAVGWKKATQLFALIQ